MQGLKQFLKRNTTKIFYATTAVSAYLLYKTAETTPDYIENAGMPLNHLQNIEPTNIVEKTAVILGAMALTQQLTKGTAKLYDKGLGFAKRLIEQNYPKATTLLKKEEKEKQEKLMAEFVKAFSSLPMEAPKVESQRKNDEQAVIQSIVLPQPVAIPSSRTLLQRVIATGINSLFNSIFFVLRYPSLIKLAEILSYFTARRNLWPEESLTESATGAVMTSASHSFIFTTSLPVIFAYHNTTTLLDYRKKVLETEAKIAAQESSKSKTQSSRRAQRINRKQPALNLKWY